MSHSIEKSLPYNDDDDNNNADDNNNNNDNNNENNNNNDNNDNLNVIKSHRGQVTMVRLPCYLILLSMIAKPGNKTGSQF